MDFHVKPASCAVLLVAFGTSASGQQATSPSYSAESIVNWATGKVGPFAPNVIATIYGKNLAWSTEAVGPQHNKVLPKELARVQVTAGILALPLLYVSPDQINFLIPANLVGSALDLQVKREGTTGPVVRVPLQEVAPALCRVDSATVLAARGDDYTLVTAEKPARPGEVVVVYASGLGLPKGVVPEDGELATVGAQGLEGITLKRLKDLRVLVAGEPLDPAQILYAGLAPGFAGVYQINLRLPETLAPDPELRIAIGDLLGPAGLKLPAREAQLSQ